MRLPTLPDQRAADYPMAPAVGDDNGDLNNSEFLEAVQRASAPLLSRGVSHGDVVGILLPNGTDFVVSL